MLATVYTHWYTYEKRFVLLQRFVQIGSSSYCIVHATTHHLFVNTQPNIFCGCRGENEYIHINRHHRFPYCTFHIIKLNCVMWCYYYPETYVSKTLTKQWKWLQSLTKIWRRKFSFYLDVVILFIFSHYTAQSVEHTLANLLVLFISGGEKKFNRKNTI